MIQTTKHVRFGPWTLAVETKRTHEANQALVPGTQRCGCFFCRQFREGRRKEDYQFFHDLEQLEVDPVRETEVTHFRELADGSHLFLGCYHVVGTVVDGPEEGTFHCWGDDVEVSVATRRDALPEHFPDPALQIDFIVRLPWRNTQVEALAESA